MFYKEEKIMKKFIALGLMVLSLNVFAHNNEPHKIVCDARSFAGDSVTLAIKNCVEHGNYDERSCARQVNCKHYQTFCVARSFAGDNVADAVRRCTELGNTLERTCLRSVSCR
jgi:hypothetical protein